jgi:hypothetical protein
MPFDNLPSEIYLRIFEYINYRRTLLALMLVCRSCHLSAKSLFYSQIELVNNHQSFLASLNSQRDERTAQSIKKLYISTFRGADQEVQNWQEFSFVIQRLPNLNTIEFDADNTDWYLDLMTDYLPVEHLKKIRHVIHNRHSVRETNRRHFKLMYKLRDTITHLTTQQFESKSIVPILRDFKSLKYLEIRSLYSTWMEFFTILQLCPQLQELSLSSLYKPPPPSSSIELVVHNTNLKRLRLEFGELPDYYVKYIVSCVPAAIDCFELGTNIDGIDWLFYGQDITLVNQFCVHLGTMKNLDLKLYRRIRERTLPELQQQLARTWLIVNKIRGTHRQKKMITSANIKLVSDPDELAVENYGCHFSISDNRYLNFSVAFPGVLGSGSFSLQDIPMQDLEDLAMIQSVEIHDQKLPEESDSLLQFMQYMVRRCTQLDRLFVLADNGSCCLIFASAALTRTSPQRYVTTPTEDNVRYASYSDILLSNHFLQATLQLFPNIQTLKLDGCEFKEPYISIDLSHLKQLHRLELRLKHIHQKNNMVFVVKMKEEKPINYCFKRAVKIAGEGPPEWASLNDETREKDEYILINILCFKVNEVEIQWSSAYQTHQSNGDAFYKYTVYPWSKSY